MAADDGEPLECWELTLPPRPPHSRLFCLAPIGVGTSAVESLTGYVTRLAAAHSVSVRRLVEEEIVPLLGRSYLMHAAEPTRSSSFWQPSEVRAFNGTGQLARDLVRVLATLTRRDELDGLTMRPWAGVVPANGQLRRQRAWCPGCYAGWREAGLPLYEPLLWTLTPVTACPRHRGRLQLACPAPDCRRSQRPLMQHARPGACSACGRWLGPGVEDQRGSGQELTDEELRSQQWIGDALGELLANAPTRPAELCRQRLAQVVTASIKEVANGNVIRFARAVGLPTETVWQWRQGLTIPSLALLLHTCARLGTTP